MRAAVIPIGTVRTSEIVAALSRALDVTEGLPAGHAARTCYLALRLADRMGVAGLVGADVFYGALLKDLGCSTYESNDSVGGLVFGRLGRVAQIGDAVDVEGHRFSVAAMDGMRIAQVRIHRPLQLE